MSAFYHRAMQEIWNQVVAGATNMPALQLAALVFNLACVILTVKRNILCWPVGIVGSLSQMALDLDPEVRLYPDAVLQGVFIALSAVGWWTWRKRADEPLRVKRAGPALVAGVCAVGAGGSFALGWFFAEVMPSLWPQVAPSNFPYADSTATVLSVMAQFLLARKYVLSWLLWIVVDVLLIGLFWQSELTFMALQYVIFLGLATAGYFSWRRAPLA